MSLAKMFEEFLGPHDMWGPIMHTRCSRLRETPQVDLYPVEGGLELKADFPGSSKEEIKLEIQGQILTLSGERKNVTECDEEHWHYTERRFGEFSRRIRLPYAVDIKSVTAKFENGVLTVGIPKPEGYNPSGKISIE